MKRLALALCLALSLTVSAQVTSHREEIDRISGEKTTTLIVKRDLGAGVNDTIDAELMFRRSASQQWKVYFRVVFCAPNLPRIGGQVPPDADCSNMHSTPCLSSCRWRMRLGSTNPPIVATVRYGEFPGRNDWLLIDLGVDAMTVFANLDYVAIEIPGTVAGGVNLLPAKQYVFWPNCRPDDAACAKADKRKPGVQI